MYYTLSWLYIEHIPFQVRILIFVFFFIFSNPEHFSMTKKERRSSLLSFVAKKGLKALELKLCCFEEYGKEMCPNAHV